ncbi:hypothetical protein DPSP01_000763 [Paraphaeosphaeria sporulosa]
MHQAPRLVSLSLVAMFRYLYGDACNATALAEHWGYWSLRRPILMEAGRIKRLMSSIAGLVTVETGTRWQSDQMFRRAERHDQGVSAAIWTCVVSNRGQKIGRYKRSDIHANYDPRYHL